MGVEGEVLGLVLAELRGLRKEIADLRAELVVDMKDLDTRIDRLEQSSAKARGMAIGIALAAGSGTAAAAEAIKHYLGM